MRTDNTLRSHFDAAAREESVVALMGDMAWDVAALASRALAFPAVIVLRVFEPVLRVVMPAIAMLGVLASVVLESSGRAPHFPFWGAMAFFASCSAAPRLLRAAARLLPY